VIADAPLPRTGLAGEAAKIGAFVRRDFRIAWSYRIAFVSDLVALAFGVASFYFIGLMVDPDVLPSYGGNATTYMEFVAVGLIFGVFVSIGLGRVASALRTEQMLGTLESVLVTPTSPTTIQLGSVAYALVYVPLRTIAVFAVIAVTFGLDVDPAGIPPAAVVFAAFLPFVWGLGLASAAAALTVRGGAGGVGLAVALMTLVSGAYFPVDLLPGWLAATAEVNPIGITLEGMRTALLGGSGLETLAHDIVALLSFSAIALVGGTVAFRLALDRERRAGTLGLY
jgi:ABC-2 type transport system permease protein